MVTNKKYLNSTYDQSLKRCNTYKYSGICIVNTTTSMALLKPSHFYNNLHTLSTINANAQSSVCTYTDQFNFQFNS